MDEIQLFAVKRTANSTDFKLRFILDGYCFSRGQTADTLPSKPSLLLKIKNNQYVHFYLLDISEIILVYKDP